MLNESEAAALATVLNEIKGIVIAVTAILGLFVARGTSRGVGRWQKIIESRLAELEKPATLKDKMEKK